MADRKKLSDGNVVSFKWKARGLNAKLLGDWRPIAEEVREATGMTYRAIGISAVSKRPGVSQAEAIKLHLCEIVRQLNVSRTLSSVAAEYRMSPAGDSKTPLEEWLDKFRDVEEVA